jgi:hypothetical protein
LNVQPTPAIAAPAEDDLTIEQLDSPALAPHGKASPTTICWSGSGFTTEKPAR